MAETTTRIIGLRPKSDGTCVVEFRTAKGESLAIPVPTSGRQGQFCRNLNLWCARRAGPDPPPNHG
jgi:hypothetical protein